MQQRSHFTQKLGELRMQLIRMAALSEQAVNNACRAYLENDTDLAESVVMNDVAINDLEDAIDAFNLELLALDQPMACDLRFIIGSMRVTVNLERVGDEAVNMAHRTLFLSTRQILPENPRMAQLCAHVQDMLAKAVRALVDEDAVLAGDICAMDHRADELSLKVLKEAINNMVDETRIVERGVHVIMASRHLERIGDLATNIAEAVIFIKEGTNVKHRCKG
ncbi:MAG: phosphate signaling complex protein PhoU [Humidesulfovibrio sp.]|jgi:phosphate transport system protein|uniref:phosphate signaling complex protein PhoU n=1 Tax=Humidesulfovibrio sp. TaxID=2910988 RepID=UPI0027348F03|nr:phosphate signaling complex protein PhoU [Humidesulfovibrio sp.]MDP2846851.1 phosphate signaling complex protein PhoU [Humidesulfovibrio sp.]